MPAFDHERRPSAAIPLNRLVGSPADAAASAPGGHEAAAGLSAVVVPANRIERIVDRNGSLRFAPRRLLSRFSLRRSMTMGRFALVGASGLVVNQILLWALVARLHLHYLPAAGLATQGSTTWNFILTERWVFPHRKARPVAVRYLIFAGINNSTLLLRAPLLVLLTSVLSLHYLLSNFLSLVALFLSRFVVSDRFIWKAAEVPGAPKVDAPQQVGDDTEQTVPAVLVDPATATPLRLPVDVVVDLNGINDRPQRPVRPVLRRPLVYRYDIDGFVAIQSEVPLHELAHFRTGFLARDVDIDLWTGPVGEHRPRLRSLVTHAPEFVSYQEHLGRLGGNFRIDFADRIEVTVSPLLARSPHVVYTNVVEALLRFVLVSRDRVLLHSATLDFDGHGVMLTARTDTGKTGTILRLLREHSDRCAFLSDDMTIVEPSGQAHWYPKPLTISAHTLYAVNQTVLTKGERLQLGIQSHLHSKQGRAAGSRLAELNLPIMALNATVQALVPPPKYAVDQLVPCRYTDKTTVRDLFVLERGRRALEELDYERAVAIMIENTDDAYGFPPFRYFAPAIQIDGYDYRLLRERERKLLGQFLGDVRARRIACDDFSWADAIPRLVAEREYSARR